MNDIETLITGTLEASLRLPQDAPDTCGAVFDRAAPFEDPVLAYLHKEETMPEGWYESVEERLFSRLEGLTKDTLTRTSEPRFEVTDEGIEALIAAETFVPHGNWDALEERLMHRIASQPRTPAPSHNQVRSPYVWPLLQVLTPIARHRVAAILALFCCAAITTISLMVNQGRRDTMATKITQAWGSSYRSDIGVPLSTGTTIACSKGGSLTLHNDAGTVSLSDDASCTIAEANKTSTEYRVFTVADHRSGRIAFDVEKRKKGQRFVVVTPWYEIHVVGTRFVLEQEPGGALATTITEGRVRIESPGLKAVFVEAGQTFSMDAAQKAWRIESAQLLAQNEQLPVQSESRERTCRLAVISSPPDAEVYINGMCKGQTPYTVLTATGACSVSVRLRGFVTRDTAIELSDSNVALDLTLEADGSGALQTPVDSITTGEESSTINKGVAAPQTARRSDSSAMATTKQAALVLRVRSLIDSARQSERERWKTALNIYQALSTDLAIPPLYRQTALFSLGRIEADRQKDTAAAIRDFGMYCILYPEGLFTGEALLRLAELEIRHNPASAIDYFQRFLLVDPRHPRRADVAYHLGLLLQQQNNFSEAVTMYKIALNQLGPASTKRKKEIDQMIGTAEAARSLSQRSTK